MSIRLLADLRGLQDPAYRDRGVGRHSLGLLRWASRFAPGVAVIGFVDHRLPAVDSEVSASVTRLTSAPVEARPSRADAVLGLSPMTHDPAPMAALVAAPDVFAAAVLYDVIPALMPEVYLRSDVDRLEYLAALAWLKRYDLLLSISQHAADGLTRLTDFDPTHIAVTGACVSRAFLRSGTPRGAEVPYFVTVGSPDPRKNVALVVDAHARLPKDSPASELVVVGPRAPGWASALNARHGRVSARRNAVTVLHQLSDSQLADLYAGAVAVVCPSRLEGFSLPVVEAAAAGSAVLLSTCDAQRELVDRVDGWFDPDDDSHLSSLMLRALRDPGWVGSLRQGQAGLDRRFLEDVVAERFWTGFLDRYQRWKRITVGTTGRARPAIAMVSPYPPERSGVADYTDRTVVALGAIADVDVWTTAENPVRGRGARQVCAIAATPYASRRYDAVVSVIGNSRFHLRELELLCSYGGACIQHDNSLLGLYYERDETEGLALRLSRSLGRDVSVEETTRWLSAPHESPTPLFDEVIAVSSPLIMHAPTLADLVETHYAVRPVVLPFCVMRPFERNDLSRSARTAARARLGIAPEAVVVATFGYLSPLKAPRECVWAVEQLRAWGIPAELHFVGSSRFGDDGAAALVKELELADAVRFVGDWIPDVVFSEYLVAADYAIQLRTHRSGLSGGLLDCAGAGLPTVVNEDLARAMDAPPYVLAVPDALSPVLIAEQIAEAFEAGSHADRLKPEREDYVRARSFDTYASLLLEALGLDVPGSDGNRR